MDYHLTKAERIEICIELHSFPSKRIWIEIKKYLLITPFDEFLIRDMMKVFRKIRLREKTGLVKGTAEGEYKSV